jgi:hypothetical protein
MKLVSMFMASWMNSALEKTIILLRSYLLSVPLLIFVGSILFNSLSTAPDQNDRFILLGKMMDALESQGRHRFSTFHC